MAEIFRKTSLEKLSSPEQLDKMIVITPPSFWIALSGAAVMIAAALVWSIFGRLPVNVGTQGIYVNDGGTYSVYAETAGVVSEVVVGSGDVISEGDVIAYLDADAIRKKMDEYSRRIENVQAVTMGSEGDVVTADNKTLIDIKDQMLTVSQTLEQDMALLKLRQEKLAEQRSVTAQAEKKLKTAEAEYYNTLNGSDVTSQQVAYSEAQSDQANAISYLEAANGSLDQARVALTQAQSNYDQAKNRYDQAVAQRISLDNAVKQREEELAEAIESGDVEAIDACRSACDAAMQVYNEYVAGGAESEAQTYLKQYEIELSAAQSTVNNYQADVDRYGSWKNSADEAYVNARDAYIAASVNVNAAAAGQSVKSNDYNIALSEYNTQYSTLLSLQDAVDQLMVQTESEREVLEAQTQAIYSQFEATKASVVDQLRSEYRQYEGQLEECSVVATVSGRISDLTIVPGSVVQQGSELVRVKQGDGNANVVVCYVALNSGKKVQEGMTVYVYPTTANKQEYGHMEATVESVDSYVSSTETLRTQLGNDSLVDAFLRDGPVIAVTCRLKEDANTISGYYWSSRKGASVALLEGTMVEAEIVIEEKAPITMVIPYIKEKLTIKAAE